MRGRDKVTQQFLPNHHVKISVPKEMLDRINRQRLQFLNRREAQHICLNRIIKFYEENYVSNES